MEFKVYCIRLPLCKSSVLIESDWNLKTIYNKHMFVIYSVLIESDWNLKDDKNYVKNYATTVLIESDWNLKFAQLNKDMGEDIRINRIRLEFKGEPR